MTDFRKFDHVERHGHLETHAGSFGTALEWVEETIAAGGAS